MPLSISLPTNKVDGDASHTAGHNATNTAANAIGAAVDALASVASSGSASDLTAGTVPTARLGSGTADSTTFLRGDQTWAVPDGGGGSSTVVVQLDPAGGAMRSTAFPALVQANGTNIPVRGLAFDAASDEAAFFRFRTANYDSGDLTVDLAWYADTASSGAVVWGAAIAAITPNTDTQDVETDSLATASTTTTTHLGTTGQRLHRTSVTVSNLDSVDSDDHVVLQVYRDADNGSDTMAGDAILVGVSVSWTGTSSGGGGGSSTVEANTQTGTTYTLVLGDAGKVVEMNNASSNVLTVPPNSSVAFPTGTVLEVAQYGAGQTTIAQGSGVTIRTPSTLILRARYSSVALRKRGTDEWVLSGDVE